MYAYLNDLSLLAMSNKSSWVLLHDMIEISSILKNDFLIELIKIPKDFKSVSIAGGPSVQQLLEDDQFDSDRKLLLLDFIGNRTLDDVIEIDDEVWKILEAKEGWAEVQYNGKGSYFLTGAYLLEVLDDIDL